MRFGFIGTGTITRAVVTGMIRFDVPFENIALSPRNAEITGKLAGLDARVTVCKSNQDVLDSSDVVCLAVVPQVASDVLGELKFDARHQIISFMAGVSIEQVFGMVRTAASVVRTVPLPAVAEGKGSTAICPPSKISRALFAPLGKAVEVDTEQQFDALSAVTATMASFYAVLEEQAAWLVRQGLPYDAARSFLSGYHVGLAHDTTRGDQPFSKMIEESSTPGGINEQLNAELQQKGIFASYSEALDRIMRRVQGRN
ncbi:MULTISPECIES: pyrroline-5-carboxylate reductase [unclassified Caballeronia]|uniref:pyrroline-5-carboxylate reductase n=1 Tax=unclassified Caballeronia TaxID=2646786 RepID=UPI0028631337|nr:MULTISPECIES: pyrroline-5-carboxylate reductase [unclassified Caballeronia]MDR5777513.1 pyrroline-5-carboxylate reductase [Caballeronia sp. LZ002]MDR5798582.1 pyrroline-5-carboxylate reductase [Caballeronia sp. LZ001]MDR5852947.1 pyrroline-5-carboxylate reductase [Caballeronia sp. LZ003]